MQILDPAVIITLLVVVGVAALDRRRPGRSRPAARPPGHPPRPHARHESIPAYYGRLHFAH